MYDRSLLLPLFDLLFRARRFSARYPRFHNSIVRVEHEVGLLILEVAGWKAHGTGYKPKHATGAMGFTEALEHIRVLYRRG